MIGKIKYIKTDGPSVGGKTIFAKNLGISLKSRGRKTVVLNMDDYYKYTKDAPKNEKRVKVLKV
jgi:uridine kinase